MSGSADMRLASPEPDQDQDNSTHLDSSHAALAIRNSNSNSNGTNREEGEGAADKQQQQQQQDSDAGHRLPSPSAPEPYSLGDDEDSELSEIDEDAIAEHDAAEDAQAAAEAEAEEHTSSGSKRKLADAYIDESSPEDHDHDNDIDDGDEDARPIEIDEDAVKMLKVAKRKRVDGKGVATKKYRDRDGGRRPPVKRTRDSGTGASSADDGDSGDEGSAIMAHPGGAGGGGISTKASSTSRGDSNREDDLTPEQRRARALERAIDEAVRGANKSRRKTHGGDLDVEVDEEIAALKTQMEYACMTDNEARQDGLPALKKLQLLPQVTRLLSRTSIRDRVLDPETNFLLSVRFFLEPLGDATLPSYTIQRELFEALQNLAIGKDALVASGLGKVVRFYTRSRNVQPNIKRMAERLVMDWTRPIVKRSDDFKKRYVETRDYDATAIELARKQAANERAKRGDSGPDDYLARLKQERERLLAPEVTSSTRFRQSMPLPPSYTIAPRSTFTAPLNDNFRPIGAAGTEAFRRMTQKAKSRTAAGNGGASGANGGRSKAKF